MHPSLASWNASVQLRRVNCLLRASQVQIKLEQLAHVFKAGFNPNQPRVPSGNPDGGRWTGGGGASGASRTDANRTPIRSLGEVPEEQPASAPLRNAILREVAKRVVKLALQDALGGPVGPILNAIEVASWVHEFAPYILAYADGPKSLEELQEAVSTPATGYDIHHIVEQTPAAQEGFPRSMIDAPDNLVRIPTFKHWELNAWYQLPNDDFGGRSPRQYLRGKDWDERTRVGRKTLVDQGILKP